jgi:hypothetical protein
MGWSDVRYGCASESPDKVEFVSRRTGFELARPLDRKRLSRRLAKGFEIEGGCGGAS